MERIVYADNAATTKVSDSVMQAMLPYLQNEYGNPSSLYTMAQLPKEMIDKAREQVAQALGANKIEIFFTSCGTESDNWAIRGIAKRMLPRGKNHIITTAIEHHAVLHTCEALEKEGFEVTYLPVNEKGLIEAKQVADAITDKTALVTIMYANNEIGTVMPIPEIGAICKEKGVVFHTDAVQAVGHIDIDVKRDNIDMLSLSGHKLHCPKGIGALYIKKGVVPESLMFGGGQERGKRPGTENTAFIVALGQGISDAVANMEENAAYSRVLRDKLMDGILSKIPACRVNGDLTHRLPGNLNVSIEGIEGESILLMLDMYGICASSGSACTSGSLDPSHVLLAMGLSHSIAHGSIRFSLNEYNTEDDVDYILEHFPGIIEKLRNMSPVWDKVNLCMIEDENLL